MSNPIAVDWVWVPQGPWMKNLIFRLWRYGEVMGTLISRTYWEFSGHWHYGQSFPFSALLSGESFALPCGPAMIYCLTTSPKTGPTDRGPEPQR